MVAAPLTYSNTFNIKQKVINRQRTEKCRIDTQLGPHTKALLQPQNHNAVKRQGGEQSPLCGKVHCDQAMITSVEAGPPGSLLPVPGVADFSRGKVFHKKKLFLLCLLGIERPLSVTHPLLFTHILIYHNHKELFSFICFCLSMVDTEHEDYRA